MQKSIQKNITLSVQLADKLEKKAKKVGLSVSEYVRILVFNDTFGKDEVYQMTPEQEKSVSIGLKDLREGRYDVLKSDDDIDKFFDNIE